MKMHEWAGEKEMTHKESRRERTVVGVPAKRTEEVIEVGDALEGKLFFFGSNEKGAQ